MGRMGVCGGRVWDEGAGIFDLCFTQQVLGTCVGVEGEVGSLVEGEGEGAPILYTARAFLPYGPNRLSNPSPQPHPYDMSQVHCPSPC